jgi:hypothetical protein
MDTLPKAKAITAPVDLELAVSSRNGNCLISVIPPTKLSGITRTPLDICCVIDISGSMADEAKIATDAGKNEGFGFSILDLVKHAVRTIIQSLESNDRISIVAYDDKPVTSIELTKMDDIGKKQAETALEKLAPMGSTNLWGGLQAGLEVLRKGSDGRNSAVFLLTDGQPNVFPKEGNLPALNNYITEFGLPGTIYTFGFGYRLDSVLLHDYAIAGNGAYSFIPDGSFVGTIFVNSLTNLLSVAANKVTLEIDVRDSAIISKDLVKHFPNKTDQDRLTIELGTVMFGQSRHIVLPLKDVTKLPLKLSYSSPFEDKRKSVSGTFELVGREDGNVDMQKFRLKFVDEMLKATKVSAQGKYPEADTIIKALMKEINASDVKEEKYMKDLLIDLSEQVTQGLTNAEYYGKWGKHYLPSLIRAHLIQQCNNFKDPGVQHYGGEIFNQIRDMLDDIFVKLPPPKPSVKKANPAPAVSNMQVFHNQYGGCFAGKSLVKMANGDIKLVQDICKDDLILSSEGKAVKIVCVQKTLCNQNKPLMVQFDNGLVITPYHPIRLNNKWEFPCTLQAPQEHDSEAIYNFVLESGHIMLINGVECVTLAHGFQEDVVRHPYFGTNAVIEDLQNMEGWERGLVVLTKEAVNRDLKTGLISGLNKTIQIQTNQSIAVNVL